MGWIILIIILIVLAVGFGIAAISIGIATIPAWGGGISVGILVFNVFRLRLLRSLRKPERISRLVRLSFDGSRLNCGINEQVLQEYANSYWVRGGSMLVAAIITVVILKYQANHTDVFVGHKILNSKMGEPDSIVFAVILSAVLILFTFLKLKPTLQFKRTIQVEVARWVASVNVSLDSVDTLRSVVQHISDLGSRLSIDFPDHYTTPISAYVEGNKSTLLLDASGLNELIGQQLALAKDDAINLEKATVVFEAMKRLYLRTAHEANKTGSPTLLQMLDESFRQIDGAKHWLSTKQWDKFLSMAGGISEHLNELYTSSVNFQENPESFGEGEVDPYYVLGVSREMSDEEIKKVYWALMKIYHDDAGLVKDEMKCKEINSAYQRLRAERKELNDK